MIRRIILSIVVFSFFAGPALAADVMEQYRVDEAMSLPKVATMLRGGSVQFYWGDQYHPAVSKTHGTFKTSKRTNALGKNRGEACAWAMASALLDLRDRVNEEGGNAVINIVSNIKNIEESSAENFSCLAGAMMVNVALKGTVVTLEK